MVEEIVLTPNQEERLQKIRKRLQEENLLVKRKRLSVNEIKILEPLPENFRSPKSRLKILQTLFKTGDKGSWKSVDSENLFRCFIEHTGREDVRVNTYHSKPKDLKGLLLNLDDYLYMLYMGKDLYQYTLPLIKNVANKKFVEPPEGWVSEDKILEVKDVSLRTLDKYCKQDFIDAVKCFGDVWYVKPNHKLFYWITNVPDYGNLVYRLEMIKTFLNKNKDFEDDLNVLFDKLEFEEDSLGIIKRGFQNKKSFKDFTVENLKTLGFEIKNLKHLRENIDLFLEESIKEKNKQYFLT